MPFFWTRRSARIMLPPGVAMSYLAEAMDVLDELGPRLGIARFQESLDPAWIEEALGATGSASMRRRRFPAEQAVWLIIGIGLFANRSILEVSEHLNLVVPGVPRVAPSSVSDARYRLCHEPMKWLFQKAATDGPIEWPELPGTDGTLFRPGGTVAAYSEGGSGYVFAVWRRFEKCVEPGQGLLFGADLAVLQPLRAGACTVMNATDGMP